MSIINYTPRAACAALAKAARKAGHRLRPGDLGQGIAARILCVSPRTVRRWCAGESPIPATALASLIAAARDPRQIASAARPMP